MTIEHQPPDPNAPVIMTLGELDGLPLGQSVAVKLDGPTTPPYDNVGGALDRGSRLGIKTRQVVTDGYEHDVWEAAHTVAAELGYARVGHPVSGRYQPHERAWLAHRNARMATHVRVLKLAGLDADDVETLRVALNLEPHHLAHENADATDAHNDRVHEERTTGEVNGARWKITANRSFYPVMPVSVTLPDGRVLSGKLDLRDYMAQVIGRLMVEDMGEGR